MADANDLREKMSRILECPICMDQYTQPKVLPCQHTYCKRCLDDMWDKSKTTIIKCPSCRKRHRIPKDGIDGFPPNVTISDLIDVQNAGDQQTRRLDSELGVHLEHLENSARYLRGLSEACDEGVVIRQRGEAVKSEITNAFKRYYTILREREMYLKKKVDKLVKSDSASRDKWKDEVKVTLGEVALLTSNVSKDQYSDSQSVIQKAGNLSREVLKVASSIPLTSQYHFTFGSQVLRTRITHFGSVLIQTSEVPLVAQSREKRRSIMSAAGQEDADAGKPIVVDYFPSQNPKYVTEVNPDDGKFSPFAVAVAPSGNIIATDLENHRAIIFTGKLERITTFGKLGAGKGDMNRPTGVSVNSEGVIYIADQMNNRVQLFDSFGRFQSAFGKKGTFPGEFVFPCGLAINEVDNVCVCDSGNFRVQVFDRNGTVLRHFGSRDQFVNQPMHLALTSLGNIIVSDQKYIRVFKEDQEVGKIYFRQPSSVTVDRFGNLIIGDNSGYLVVLRESGEELCRIGTIGKAPGQFVEPRGLAVTKRGYIVAGDCAANRLQMFAIKIVHDEIDSRE